MRFTKVLICFLGFVFSQDMNAQCNTCDAINFNGDFEAQNNIPGASHDLGISLGEIENWYATHGTADYFNSEWNWYYVDGIQNNAAHVCYGNRPNHDHSEGIYTKVNITGNSEVQYCLELDLAAFCNKNKHGRLHVYLANNLEQGGQNGFSFPSPASHPDLFQESKMLDIITLDESTYYDVNGLTKFNIPFTTETDYNQVWLFTEFLHDDIEFANCGVMIDNVKLTGAADLLKSIDIEEHSERVFSFSPEIKNYTNNFTYDWDFGNGTYSTALNPTVEFNEGLYDISLKIKDENGTCSTKKVQLKVGEVETDELCSYKACLDSNGVPVISSIELQTPTGETVVLDNTTEGFGFPYCIGTTSLCSSGENELEYFVLDLNSWLTHNNYSGTTILNEDKRDDNCRANLFTIVETDLNFIALSLGFENDVLAEQVIYFDTESCVLQLRRDKNTEDQKIFDEIEINVYPNPAAEFLNITFEENASNAIISLIDFNGKAVQKEIVSNVTKDIARQIDLQGLIPGNYFVQVILNDKTITKQIMRI